MIMVLTDVWTWVGALLAGAVLGSVFFGGLWWTVRRGIASPRPALWFVSSLVARVALALAGIYLVSGGQWQRLLACLLGFWLARALVMRITAASVADRAVPEVRHAP